MLIYRQARIAYRTLNKNAGRSPPSAGRRSQAHLRKALHSFDDFVAFGGLAINAVFPNDSIMFIITKRPLLSSRIFDTK